MESTEHIADLTGDVCPMTFVKARMHLQKTETGQVAEIVLKGVDQLKSIPSSLRDDGHNIEKVENRRGVYHLFVRKQ